MAGEQNHKRISKVVTEEARAAVDAADNPSGAFISVNTSKLPKWLTTPVLSLLLGGSLGTGFTSLVDKGQSVQVVAITKSDVERIVADKVAGESDKQRAAQKDDNLALQRRLDDVNSKLVTNQQLLQELRLEMARLKQ